MARPRILLSAGDPSGDVHGAALVSALRARWPDAELYGLGGPRMAAAGMRLLADFDRLAVMGLAEVAGRVPFFIRLFRRLRAGLADDPPDLVIPIDYPGFNLRLARAANERRVRVLYYIAPQVWAWHRSRARKLARYADRMAVILPFEEAVFRSAGGQATFVGHPLLDAEPPRRPRTELCEALGLDASRPILALFPGSRRQELERHLQLFARAVERVRESRPDVQPVIAAGATLDDALFAGTQLPRTRDAWELLHHATAALVKSGTSTLQAALTITPMVVAYRMHPATFAVARRVVRVPHVGLANLVAGDRVVPELLQDAATPAALAAALLPLMEEGSEVRRRAESGLARVRGALAAAADSSTVADRVAALAAELIASNGAARA